MADGDEKGLGGRLALVDPAHLSEGQRWLWSRLERTLAADASKVGFQAKTQDGRFIGPFNPVLYHPELGASFVELQVAERRFSRLDPRVREVVILSVGSIWRSDYELYAHEASARAAGFSQAAAEALAAGRPHPELGEAERLAQRVTLALNVDHRLDATLYEAAEAAFGADGLVDLVVLCGCYHTVCGLLNAFDIPRPRG